MYRMMGVAGGRAEAYAKLQGQVPVDKSEESAALHLGVTRLFHVGHVVRQRADSLLWHRCKSKPMLVCCGYRYGSSHSRVTSRCLVV